MLKSYRSIDCSIVVLTSWMCRIASVRDILSRVRPLTSSISSPTSRLSRSDGEPYNLILPSAFSTRMITYPESSTTCCCNYEKERDNHMNRKRQKKLKSNTNQVHQHYYKIQTKPTKITKIKRTNHNSKHYK